jgi:mevalonate kinase
MPHLNHIELSAPGKLILCGEHSVVYGKQALASAIDLRTHLCAHRTPDTEPASNTFTLNLPDINRTLQITPTEFTRLRQNSTTSLNDAISSLIDARRENSNSTSIDKPLEAIRFLIMCIGDELVWESLSGLRVELKSDIPVAAGLGSSASFCVCLATFFLLVSSKIPSQTALLDTHLETICTYSFALERIFHGKPSGIDNSVACYGNYVRFGNGTILEKFTSTLDMPILIVNSLVPKETSVQVAKVKSLYARNTPIMECLMETIDAVVTRFVSSLKTTTNGVVLRDLVAFNQGLLHGLQISNYELDLIVGVASKYKWEAKITGSGGGGCCFVLLVDGDDGGVGKEEERRFAERLRGLVEELQRLGFNSFRSKLGCKGVCVERLEFF